MSLPLLIALILLVPLFAAGIILVFLRRRGWAASIVSVAASGLVLLFSILTFLRWDGSDQSDSIPWMALGHFEISIGYYLSPLSVLMLLVVSFVAFWIHLFSVGYMDSDTCKGRYFGGLSIFMFSMLGIVVADNLFMLFIFWELVGFSSYMLIDHYFERPAAAEASKKAFIVNRIGDFGFLIGIIWCYWHFGTVQIKTLQAVVAMDRSVLVTGMGLCLFCGVLGKSAQMPLHVWLPDAMEGPTPVSALIHAATMVAAGVYFLCRLYFIFTVDALTVVTWIGAVTALYAALCAVCQSDIKKILAFSTLSQLGFMVAAMGLGTRVGLDSGAETAALLGVSAAMFHLTTHAFFKALLFLGAGSIIHACHHEQDIFQMGGLIRKMPWTAVTFTVGVIAISGVPFLGAGFFSKDAILYLAIENDTAVWVVLVMAATLTSFYMGRLWVVAFFGQGNSENVAQARESSWVMVLPLAVLALCSIAGGWVNLYPEKFDSLLQVMHHPQGGDFTLMLALAFGCSLVGLIGAWFVYGPGAAKDRLQGYLPKPYWALSRRLYFDDLYDGFVKKVQQPLADFLHFADMLFISGLMVRGTAGMVGLMGIIVRATHVGSVHAYVYWFLFGVILYWAFAVGWL